MSTLLLVVLGLVLWPLLHSTVFPRDKMICRNCGSIAQAAVQTPRQFPVEILLWFAGLFPGVIYTLWCNHHTHRICAKCASRDIVPLDSPVGQKLAGKAMVDVTPMSEEL